MTGGAREPGRRKTEDRGKSHKGGALHLAVCAGDRGGHRFHQASPRNPRSQPRKTLVKHSWGLTQHPFYCEALNVSCRGCYEKTENRGKEECLKSPSPVRATPGWPGPSTGCPGQAQARGGPCQPTHTPRQLRHHGICVACVETELVTLPERPPGARGVGSLQDTSCQQWILRGPSCKDTRAREWLGKARNPIPLPAPL